MPASWTGPAGAHKVMKRSEAPARTLLFSSARLLAVSVYPDSNRIGFWPGNDEDDLVFRRDSAVSWSNGEGAGTKPANPDSGSCETGTRMDGIAPYAVRPIGVVRSTLRAPAEAPNQAFEGAPEAVLEIEPMFADALHRIRVGDELVLLTWLHLADRDVLQTHPTGDTNVPLTGVFRTRSPDRPHPIGVHRVTVTALEGPTTLRVGALETIDGTPIIDLKIAMREAPEA